MRDYFYLVLLVALSLAMSQEVQREVVLKIPVSGVTTTPNVIPPVLAEGTKLTLRCIAEEGSNMSYQWYFNHEEMTEISSSNQSDLIINKANVSHSGKYRCEARNLFNLSASSVTSNDTQITVRVPVSNPTIVVKIMEVPQVTLMAVVTCLSNKGTLPIDYTLFKNMSSVTMESAKSVRRVEFIVPINQNQGDVYKCKASNGFTTKYSNGLVVDLSVNLTSRHTAEQRIELTCIVNYTFVGKYTWYFVAPGMNDTQQTSENYWKIDPIKPGKYYCSVNKQLSNSFEMPASGKGAEWQTPMGVIITVVAVLVILFVSCICYCVWKCCRG